jgi:hypothetical protein
MKKADVMQVPRTHRSPGAPRRALIAAAVLAAAAIAPAVDAVAAAGPPPARLAAAPAGVPAPAASRQSLVPANFARLAQLGMDLCATTGSTQIPRASGTTPDTVAVWSYVEGDCSPGSGTATLGGAPVIRLVEGDVLTLTLHNDLPRTTSISFQGQTMPTDRVGAAPGQTRTYTLHADRPGTFLYEAGLAGDVAAQVGMGLYGVLIVDPATPGQAYGAATTAYDAESIVLVSEVDPALNANPLAFDMRNFAPKWTALNGRVFATTGSLATVAPGDALLLRYLNAGTNYHSMSLLGGNQRIIADDGNPLTHDRGVVSQTVGPGQTVDAIVDISAGAQDGTQLTVFDSNLQLRNRNRRPTAAGTFRTYGGPLAFITVSAASSPDDTTGPVTSAPSASAVSGVVTASVSDAATGGSDVVAAEYSLDTIATAGTGTLMAATDGSFDAPTEGVIATIPAGTLADLPSGVHTAYIRGRDAALNWGAPTAVSFRIDRAGPVTSGVAVSPNPTPGTGTVTVHATGSETTTGGANVVAAEYFVDTAVVDGTGTVMVVNNPLVTASLDAVLAVSSLASGNHTVSVHAQDALGNWGPASTVTLVVDRAGPTVSGAVASPNPTNGVIGVNSSTSAVRLTASATDAASTIASAEGFIDTLGATDAGFPMLPADGAWSSTTEALTVDIPLTTVRTLADGEHTLFVRARDKAGNWGTAVNMVLVVDKAAPTQSGLTIAVDYPAGTATVTINATDVGTGVQRVELYLDTDPGRGLGTPLTLVTGSTYQATLPLSSLANGVYAVVVRSRDAASNWSANLSGTLTVAKSLWFSTVGDSNPPGVIGTADNSDIYSFDGSGFGRAVDVTAIPGPVPASANVDGLVRVSSTQFYVSFVDNTTLPGIGTVQDEDVVRYDAGTWSVFFDGTARGLTSANLDIDAFDVVGTTIYFSTSGNTNPPGVAGTADDADIYAWNGTAFARAVDVSAIGVAGAANVDGLSVRDTTHFFVTFAADTSLTGPGSVQDEDVVYRNGTLWQLWFDGTARNLTSANLDLDAIDVA